MGYGLNAYNETSELITLTHFIAKEATIYVADREMWMRFISDDVGQHRGVDLVIYRGPLGICEYNLTLTYLMLPLSNE